VPLLDAAPSLPEPVAATVMRGLATEPADRYETAESFGIALAGAGAEAWGPGWLLAEPVPVMDAGPVIRAAGPVAGAVPGAETAPGAVASAAPETVATPVPGQAPARPGRSRQVIIAAVVVAVIVAVIVVVLETHLFTVYKSNGLGPIRGVMYG
jgi:hypothetical protein